MNTLGQIEWWARTHQIDDVAGVAGQPHECPLLVFFHDTHPEEPVIECHSHGYAVKMSEPPYRCYVTYPDPLYTEFIRHVDSYPPRTRVTYRQVLAILDTMRAAHAEKETVPCPA